MPAPNHPKGRSKRIRSTSSFPNMCLHLLLASRGDPPLALSRLRARGQVVEIRDTDLRLSGEEAASFLTQVMGLALSEEDIRHLETRTEGWIAGLQLAALSMRRHTDV